MSRYKGTQSAPSAQSFSFRHRVGRLRVVPQVAAHLKAGRKFTIRWRERLRLDALDSIGRRESRPVFSELLSRALLRIKTAFQVGAGILRKPRLGCAAAACGYIPVWNTTRCRGRIACTNRDAEHENGYTGKH